MCACASVWNNKAVAPTQPLQYRSTCRIVPHVRMRMPSLRVGKYWAHDMWNGNAGGTHVFYLIYSANHA